MDDSTIIEPEGFIPDDAPAGFEPEAPAAKAARLRAELAQVRGQDKFAGWFGGSESIVPPLLLPPEAPGSVENVLRRLPLGAGRDEALRQERVEGISSAVRSIEGGVRSAGQPENLPLIPLAVIPGVAPAMGLYFGGTAFGAGAGEALVGFQQGNASMAGGGTGTALLGTGITRQGFKQIILPRSLAEVRNVPDVGYPPVIEKAPITSEAIPAPETLIQEPSGMRVVQQKPAPVPQGGIPATAEMLETLPKPTIEELAINELLRGEGAEMRQLIEAEGRAIQRTGEMVPKPILTGDVQGAGLPSQSQQPSGIRMAPESAVVEAKGGLPTAESTLDLLRAGKPEELPINELTRGAGGEMERLVTEEGKAIERTGQALPQPSKVADPVSIGQPGIPTVPESSGLRMAVDALPETAKGGTKAVVDMLDLLPEGEIKEVAMNELTRQGIERGEALRRVEALGDAIRRVRDFSKAKAEATGQSVTANIAEGIINEVHPEKPMTPNQLRITKASLIRALMENRLSEERPGIISGSRLEAWAERTIEQGRGRVSAGLDPVQLAAYIVKGAALLERGIVTAAEWTAAMIKEYGPQIRPYLKQIREQSDITRAAMFNASRKEPNAVQERGATPQVRGLPAQPGVNEGNVSTKESSSGVPRSQQAQEGTGRAEVPLKMAESPATGATDVAAPPKGPASSTWGNLQSLRQRLQFTFKGASTKKDIAGWADAIENKAKLYARQQSNEIRDVLANALGKPVKRLTPIEEAALTFTVEAGGDANKLTSDLEALRAHEAKPDITNLKATQEAIKAVQEALLNLGKYSTAAERYNQITENQLAQEQASGINTQKSKNYVPHLQDVADDFQTIFESGGGTGSTGFKHVRTHPDFVSSITANVKPKTLNAIKALEMRLEAGQRQINTRTWISELRQLTDPTSNRPLVVDMERVSRGVGQPDDVIAPRGYVPMNLGRQNVAVLNGYSRFLRLITGESVLGDRPIGAALMKGVTGFKHVALAFDLFHLANITRLGASFDPVRLGVLRDYKQGLWLTDYALETLRAMTKRGEIPTDVLPQLLEDKRIIEQGVKAGFNVGQLQQALYTDWVRKVPGIGTFNKFLFEKYQRGIMGKAFVIEFRRAKAARPELSDTKIATNVARDLNIRFANLRRQSWIKSKTFQDLMRLVFLAPQWNEGLLRSEIGAVRQAGVASVEAGLHRRIVAGSLLKSAGTLFLAQLVGNQILNYIFSGRPTWHNPEDHKLDAYVPDVIGQSNGYYISPYTMDGELTHQLATQIGKSKGNVMKAIRDVAFYKLGHLGRAAKTFITQTNYRGKQLTGWETARQMAVDLAPVPIGVPAVGRGIYRAATGEPVEEDYPGATQKSLLQTGGFKAERARATP